MSILITALVAGAVIVIGIPAAALFGSGMGRRMRGNLQVAAVLLGLGEPLDPPSKHRIEAGERDENERPTSGEPPASR